MLTATERVRVLTSGLIWDLTATERVRDVSSIDTRYEFTTPGRISVAFWATACGVTPVLTSGRSEPGTNSYATGDSHPFSCSQIPVQLHSVPPFSCSQIPDPCAPGEPGERSFPLTISRR